LCTYIEKMMDKNNKAMGEDLAKEFTLVVGSRELGFFSRTFLGSTSEYCVNHCPCPVVVVKKHHIEPEKEEGTNEVVEGAEIQV